MRDISSKITTLRTATAQATLKVKPSVVELILSHKVPKGDPLIVAKVAAIQAAKNTSQIIPYCHQIPIDHVNIEFQLNEDSINITSTVKAIHKTGVEMEALTSASVAALTIYDMTKMLDEAMHIASVELVNKTGGKTAFAHQSKSAACAAVLVISDTVSAGKKTDTTGQLIADRLKQEGLEVVDYSVIPDDQELIEKTLIAYADDKGIELVITTGGTGLSPRDNTPEATLKVLDREIPGIAEAIRSYGQDRTPYSMLSRAITGVRKNTLIINLPGSKNGVKESLDALFPAILHVFKVLKGFRHISDQRDVVRT